MSRPKVRYAVVSPVRDEERYVELTLRSMVEQTVQPARWVIVDDGSSDQTPQILARYAAQHPFIRVLRHRAGGLRRPGSPVIHAFHHGYESLAGVDFDFVVKLDCDLSFAPDYFERLFQRFDLDPWLGIGSGVYFESDAAGKWTQVAMPAYHAFGASKVLRKACFDEIGGFPAAAGWDTVDEIRAMSRGWKTGHFTDLPVRHHKREGSGIGSLRTSRIHGEIFYVTGGDPLFLLFKVMHRMMRPPVLLSGLALATGYLDAIVRRKPRLVTRAEAQRYKELLRRRLFGRPAGQQPSSQPAR